MKENCENKVEFEYSIPNMDAIVEYLYTGEIKFTEDNITEITNMSCYFQVNITIIFY